MVRRISISIVLAFASFVISVAAVNGQSRNSAHSQSDPPGFGVVFVKPGQTIRLNVTCFDDTVGRFPPGPCHASGEFHNGVGGSLSAQTFDLQPGQTRSMDLMIPVPTLNVDALSLPVLILPCIMPAPGGLVIPSVEVLDGTGRTLLFENAASPEMSEFNNAFTNPASISGFNPQPDPPGFGAVTLVAGQTANMNIACFEDPVAGTPPAPCRGTVEFHNAAGAVLNRQTQTYDLQPGQTATFSFQSSTDRGLGAFIPCITPAPGGRAVPNLMVMDGAGNVALLINPAAARMSQFQ